MKVYPIAKPNAKIDKKDRGFSIFFALTALFEISSPIYFSEMKFDD